MHFGGDINSDTSQYAIRPTIRNHSLLKRDVVINTIANLIDKSHKVSLTNPDKVILVELYQVSDSSTAGIPVTCRRSHP